MGEARKEQSIVEGKIAELENTLARAEVVDASKFSGDTIKFGAYVTIQNSKKGAQFGQKLGT